MDENFTRGYCQLKDPPVMRRTNEKLGAPRDPYSCIYLALLLAGAGFLLPYNSFITAVDYYQSRFPGTTIIFDMSLTYIVMAFVSVCINNVLIETLSLQLRITFGYILAFFTLLFIALCDVWFEVFSNSMSYKITLAAVATVAIGSTVQQSSFYGYTSMLPRRYTQAVMTGESAAGLLISLNRILTKALLDNQKVNTIIFFCISISIVWMCCIIFHITHRTDFVRYYVSLCEKAGVTDDQKGIANPGMFTEEVDIMDHNSHRGSYGVLVIQSPTATSIGQEFPRLEQVPQNPPAAASPPTPAEVIQQSESEVRFKGHVYKVHVPKVSAVKKAVLMRYDVAKTVWPYMVSIGLAYFVTLCLFPGIESEVISCHLRTWMPVILMAVFNLFDFIGKIFASVPYDWSKCRLVLCTLCRIILVPLTMLCATPRDKPVLASEGWSILLSIILGLTNGYFGSVPMILAPMTVPDEQKEITGNIMMFSYSVGLTTGSVAAYLIDDLLGSPLQGDPCIPHNLTAAFQPNKTVMMEASY